MFSSVLYLQLLKVFNVHILNLFPFVILLHYSLSIICTEMLMPKIGFSFEIYLFTNSLESCSCSFLLRESELFL